MSLADFLAAFELPFISRAGITVAVLAISAGVVGFFISFRDMEFLTDGLVHAVFPGLVIGYLVGGSALVLPGALVAALATTALLTWFTTRGSASTRGAGAAGAGGEFTDAAIAVLLSGTFSLGIVLVSRQESYVSALESLLFGHLLTVTETQLVEIIVVSAVAVAIMLFTWRAQLFRAHDPVGFLAAGFNPLRTDLWLGTAIALLVVAGVQALGSLMVLAVLIVPMAAARQITRKLVWLIPVAIAVTFVAGFAGISVSIWAAFELDRNASAGASVVLAMITIYLAAAAIRALTRSGERRA